MGRNSSFGIETPYGLDFPGIESRWGESSAPVHIGPRAHPASYTMVTESLLWVKRPVPGLDHSSPSRTEVEERVELYIYYPVGPSWRVIG